MSDVGFGPVYPQELNMEPAPEETPEGTTGETTGEAIGGAMEIDDDQVEEVVSPFLTLPLHIREKIYGELLSMDNTRTMVPHEDWDASEMLDSHYNSAIATDLPDVTCARVTKYNFDTAILRVNRQTNWEATPFLGWKNQWVVVRIGEASLAKELQLAGSAIPVEETSGLDKFFTGCRAAFEITVSGKPSRGADCYHEMVMGINGIHDLVTILLGGKWEPWCILVSISKEHIFPKSNSFNIERQILDMFIPLRIRSKPYNSSIRDPGPLVVLEVLEVDGHKARAVPSLRLPLSGNQVLGFIRQLLPPYPVDRESIDWKAEGMIMSDWSFYFNEALTKYADTMDDENISSLWRDTLCMAHARLMVIHLGLGDLEQASFHSTRTCEMAERVSPMIWYYRCAIDEIGDNAARYSKSATEEILDIGWCMSRLEHRDWMAFLWLWARENDKGEAHMMAMLSHKIEAARHLAGPPRGSWEQMLIIFDKLMEAQVARLADSCSEEEIQELITQKGSIEDDEAGYNSLESICAHFSIPMWILN